MTIRDNPPPSPLDHSLPGPFDRWSYVDLALSLLVALGAVLRLRKYLFNRSLWLDEAALAVNILEQDPLALVGPLEFGQVAPYGFLLVSKALAALLGSSEMVLRLLPFLAGLAALVLAALLLRSTVAPMASTLALAVFAVAPPQVMYSVELKPYASDVAVALVFLLMVVRREYGPRHEHARWPWLLAGAAAVWLSYPAIFVLAAIGATDTVGATLNGQWRRLRRWFPVYLGWIASFALSLPQISAARARLAELPHWESAFMPLPPTSMADLEWFLDHFLGALDSILGVPDWSGGALLVLLGMVLLAVRKRALAGTIVGAVAFLLAASGLELYPAEDRAVLFLAGPLLLAAAVTVDEVLQRLRGSGLLWLGAAAFVPMLLWAPTLESYREFRVPPRQEEMRDVMEVLDERYQQGDSIYVYYGAEPAARYYARRLGMETLPYDFGSRARGNPELYLDEVADHLGEERSWFVFAHDFFGQHGNEREFVLSALNCFGEQQIEVRRPGAHLYLYDLTVPRGVDPDASWRNCTP